MNPYGSKERLFEMINFVAKETIKTPLNEEFEDITPDEVIELGQERDKYGDGMEGGIGDNDSYDEFTLDQLIKGLEIESEHTDNPKIALSIVIDHLCENENYYMYLEKMETEMNQDEPKTDEQNLTDELLGFKPINVGHYSK